MDTLSLLNQLVWWIDISGLLVFLMMETYWFVKQKKSSRKLPEFLLAFIIYNLPFLTLLPAIYFNDPDVVWLAGVRLFTLSTFFIVNIWLHYHGDKGGNSVGMAIIFFLIISVPVIVIQEVCIWLA